MTSSDNLSQQTDHDSSGTEQSVTSGLGVNIKADSLTEGDEVILGDRERPLKVVDRHERPIHRRTRRDERDYHDVVELTGNGTEYHLLWQHGSTHEPILRRRSQWTETDDGDVEYSAQGERIYEIEILSDDTERGDGQ